MKETDVITYTSPFLNTRCYEVPNRLQHIIYNNNTSCAIYMHICRYNRTAHKINFLRVINTAYVICVPAPPCWNAKSPIKFTANPATEMIIRRS